MTGENIGLVITTLPDNGGAAITQIDVELTDDLSEVTVENIEASAPGTFELPILSADYYLVRIRAVNSVGAGEWSDVKSVLD